MLLFLQHTRTHAHAHAHTHTHTHWLSVKLSSCLFVVCERAALFHMYISVLGMEDEQMHVGYIPPV